MNRRGFLRSLLAVAVAALTPKMLKVKTQPTAAVPHDQLSAETIRKAEQQLAGADAMPRREYVMVSERWHSDGRGEWRIEDGPWFRIENPWGCAPILSMDAWADDIAWCQWDYPTSHAEARALQLMRMPVRMMREGYVPRIGEDGLLQISGVVE